MGKAPNQVEYILTISKQGEETRQLQRTFDCSDNHGLMEALGWLTGVLELGKFLGYDIMTKDIWTRKEE